MWKICESRQRVLPQTAVCTSFKQPLLCNYAISPRMMLLIFLDSTYGKYNIHVASTVWDCGTSVLMWKPASRITSRSSPPLHRHPPFYPLNHPSWLSNEVARMVYVGKIKSWKRGHCGSNPKQKKEPHPSMQQKKSLQWTILTRKVPGHNFFFFFFSKRGKICQMHLFLNSPCCLFIVCYVTLSRVISICVDR